MHKYGGEQQLGFPLLWHTPPLSLPLSPSHLLASALCRSGCFSRLLLVPPQLLAKYHKMQARERQIHRQLLTLVLFILYC